MVTPLDFTSWALFVTHSKPIGNPILCKSLQGYWNCKVLAGPHPVILTRHHWRLVLECSTKSSWCLRRSIGPGLICLVICIFFETKSTTAKLVWATLWWIHQRFPAYWWSWFFPPPPSIFRRTPMPCQRALAPAEFQYISPVPHEVIWNLDWFFFPFKKIVII